MLINLIKANKMQGVVEIILIFNKYGMVFINDFPAGLLN